LLEREREGVVPNDSFGLVRLFAVGSAVFRRKKGGTGRRESSTFDV
jgi:hypothetical protein